MEEQEDWASFRYLPTPLTIQGAKGTASQAYRHIIELENTLSGCEWCCGGGDQLRGMLIDTLEHNIKWLKSQGVDFVPQTPCTACFHYAPVPGSNLCEKCKPLTSEDEHDSASPITRYIKLRAE